MARAFKRIIVLILCSLLCTVFFSCTGEKNGKSKLVEVMYSDYIAEAEYLFEVGESCVAGTMRITRDENVRIELLSPDPYTGICVTGDAADNVSVLTISYSGVKAEIAKNVLSRLNLILAMFSDTASSAVDGAGKDAFTVCEDQYSESEVSGSVPYEVQFSIGDAQCVYIYDSTSGKLLDMRAVSGDTSVQIKIKKLKTAEQ